jgi:hypothetical protein
MFGEYLHAIKDNNFDKLKLLTTPKLFTKTVNWIN